MHGKNTACYLVGTEVCIFLIPEVESFLSKEWLLVLQESHSSNCCNVLGYCICTCFNMPRAATVTLFQVTWFTEKNFPKFDIKSMGRCEAFKNIF